MTDSRMTFATQSAVLRIERIQGMLRAQDMTLQEIADGIHLTLRWTREYIAHLHQNKMVHIAGYRLQSMQHKTVSHALYCWGEAKDAPKPPALTGAQRARRKRERLLDDMEARDKHLAKRRAARWTPTRDWTASWIPTKAQGGL